MRSNDNARGTDVSGSLAFGVWLVPFAPVWAAGCGAELTGVGALDPAEFVGLLVVGAGDEALAFVSVAGVAAAGGGDGAGGGGEGGAGGGGATGLTGLTGLCTLVGFVTDLTHVFVVVVHAPITGCP